MAMPLLLDDRAVISVSGPEARAFLQGLVTNAMDHIGAGDLAYAALLTPQGKILFDFLMTERDGALLLDCRSDVRDALARRLSLYKLRAKVEITVRPDLAVVWSRNAQDGLIPDPRLSGLGARAVLPSAEAPAGSGAEQFAAVRLALGVPEGHDFGQDAIFALDSDLDELHGIAFDKGCYVGQELTARMKHRGTARKRLLPTISTGDAPLPATGTSVTADGRDIGTLTSTYGTRGFALVRLDRLEEAKGLPLRADHVAVTVTKPNWLFT